MHTRGAAILAMALLVTMPAAAAREEDGRGTVWSWFGDWDPSFYAGAGFQQSDFREWSAVAQTDSASFTSRAVDDTGAGFRIAGGMTFRDHFALEASYADFGSASFVGVSDGSGTVWEPGPQREELDLQGIGLHLVGRVPVATHWNVSARAGAWSLRAERRQAGTVDVLGTPTPYDTRDADLSTEFGYGAALEYDGLAPVRLALEFDATAVPDEPALDAGTLRSFGLSLKYVFAPPAGG